MQNLSHLGHSALTFHVFSRSTDTFTKSLEDSQRCFRVQKNPYFEQVVHVLIKIFTNLRCLLSSIERSRRHNHAEKLLVFESKQEFKPAETPKIM